MRKFHLIATAAFGLEGVVAAELRRMGYEVETENGRVRFCGTMADIARCNLNLRVADRLLIEVGRFKATSFEELFEGVRALPWEEYIPKEGCFPAVSYTHLGRLTVMKDLGMREPYVGQVRLQSGEIADDFAFYFTVSEQQPCLVSLGVLVDSTAVQAAGGIQVSPMPGCSEETLQKLEQKAGELSHICLLYTSGQDLKVLPAPEIAW